MGVFHKKIRVLLLCSCLKSWPGWFMEVNKWTNKEEDIICAVIKFPKKHLVQEHLFIADLWECHLLCPAAPAIIIESCSQKADYHNRHIKRSWVVDCSLFGAKLVKSVEKGKGQQVEKYGKQQQVKQYRKQRNI